MQDKAAYMRDYRSTRPGIRDGEGIRYRQRNPERVRMLHNANKAKAKERNRAYVKNHKENHPCLDCGESNPRRLHFDHRPGTIKITCVSIMVRHGWSLEKIQSEIDKCDVRCYSCHAKRHWPERSKKIRRNYGKRT